MPTWFYYVLTLVAILIVAVFTYYLITKRRRDVELANLERELLEHEQDAFESAVERLRDKMALPSLVELNRIMLEKYHGIATEQAEVSFRSSQRAMWAGFSLLVACFTTSLLVPGAQLKIFLGSIAVIGGALSGYLGKTYLRVYDRSLEQLNHYYDQPLLNSYYLMAERVAGDVSTDSRDQILAQIIERLLKSTEKIDSPLGSYTQRKRIKNKAKSRSRT